MKNSVNSVNSVSNFPVYQFDIAHCQNLLDMDELILAFCADESLTIGELFDLAEQANARIVALNPWSAAVSPTSRSHIAKPKAVGFTPPVAWN